MEKLNQIFQKHINEGKYPGVQWKINFNNKNYEGKVGYKNLETKEKDRKDSRYADPIVVNA